MNTLRGRTELAPEDERVILKAATAAPSLHNSQPWSFDVAADHIDVYADPSRQLRRTDPSGRSLLIGCGAALFNVRVAAEHLTFRPRVRVLPDAADLTLVANVGLDRRHAHVGGLAAYFPAVAARRTNRLPFHDRPVPHVLAGLAQAARVENAMLRIYDDQDEVSRLVDLLGEADLAETDDLAVRAERDAWIGGPHRDDGVPARSLGPRPEEPRTPFRDLGHAVAGPREYARFERTPTLAILSTSHDEPADLGARRAGLGAGAARGDRGRARRVVHEPALGTR